MPIYSLQSNGCWAKPQTPVTGPGKRLTQLRVLVLVLVLVLGGCATRQPSAPPPFDPEGAIPPATQAQKPAGYPSAGLQGQPAEALLTVVDSQLLVKVYRAGRLKHLGHNHVLSSTKLHGLLLWPEHQSAPTFAHLYFAADSFVVDDPVLRSAAGADFASKPSAADRANTTRNMLGPRVLNAQQFPWVDVRG